MTAATLAPPAAGPLTPEHRRELALAQSRAKPILKAARVAAFNGWTLGAIAALSAPFAMFSIVGAAMTIALAVFAINEFRGRRRLLAFDPGAAALLGWNQVALLTVLVGYSLWMLWQGLAGQGPFAAEIQANPELGEALGSLGDFDGLYRQFVTAFYGMIIALSVAIQGLNALYYFRRGKLLAAYREDTPAWAVELQRMTAGD